MLVEMTDVDGTTHYRVYRDGVLVGLFAARSTCDARAALDALCRALKAPPAPVLE